MDAQAIDGLVHGVNIVIVPNVNFYVSLHL